MTLLLNIAKRLALEAQIKEKWGALFERYKAIVDNSKKTGRGYPGCQRFFLVGGNRIGRRSLEGESGSGERATRPLASRVGRGRESFEFFEIMDEFLGCSGKVRPKFVKQTQ